MRILVLGINYAPDLIGVAKYTTELCENLTASGHAVRVVTAPPYYPDWKIPEQYRSRWYAHQRLNDVDIIRVPIYVPNRPSAAKRLIHHASFLLSAAAPLLATAVRWRPDLVFAVAPSLLSAPIAALAARAAAAASWLHIQDLEVDAAFELGLLKNHRARRLMLGVERMILRMFERVSTISPQMMRCLEQKGVASERLYELRNWVDTSVIVSGARATSFRSELGLKETDIVLLYSGAMSHKQGLELIIEAARAISSSHPSLHFVLCGNGPVKDALIRMADGLSNVHFLPLQPSERLPELLSTADIHLLPQKAQVADLVLPSKLAGMLASGRPVVAMAEPQTGIAMETQGAGLIVPPGDAVALADAVIALAQNGDLRAEFGAAARLRAEQTWDRASVIGSIEREFRALPPRIARSAARPRPSGFPARPIEQITTGTSRGLERTQHTLASHARQPTGSVSSSHE